jgi:hypothetical protein
MRGKSSDWQQFQDQQLQILHTAKANLKIFNTKKNIQMKNKPDPAY